MASSDDQQTQPNLMVMAMPTTLNHISIAVNRKQEEHDQTFGNINYMTPNSIQQVSNFLSLFSFSRLRFRFIYVGLIST